jgi:hypothetical protein
MAGLQSVRAQQICPVLLLNQFFQCVGGWLGQDDVRQNPFRGPFIEGSDWRIHAGGSRSRWSCDQMLREPVSHDVVLALAFLGDHGFYRSAEADLVSLGASADEVEQEVGPGHDRRSMADEAVAGPGPGCVRASLLGNCLAGRVTLGSPSRVKQGVRRSRQGSPTDCGWWRVVGSR